MTIEQVASDVGVHPMMWWKWLRQTDVEGVAESGITSDAAFELRELQRRN